MPKTVSIEIPALEGENPLWSSLKNKINELELELSELRAQPSSTVTRNRIKQSEAMLSSFEERLRETPEREVLHGPRIDTRPNEARILVQAKLVEAKAQAANLEKQLEQLQGSRGEVVQRRGKIMSCREGHAEKTSNLDQAKRLLVQISDRRAEAERFGALNQDRMSNFQVILEPTHSQDKVGPERKKPVLAGLAGGMALGLLLAALRQLLDPKIRYPETLESAYGLRVLAVVPEARQLRNQPRNSEVA